LERKKTITAGKERMPSILLFFVPKTAGGYIWHGLMEGSNLKSMRISGNYFPGGAVMPPIVGEFSKGGYCMHDHFEANWRNKSIISAFLDKMILNVRNPRMKKQ
jgi:hypothetical protein